jgi:MYXO-CTERM domain-containing protein
MKTVTPLIRITQKVAPFALLAALGLETRSAAAVTYFEDVTETMFPAPACGVEEEGEEYRLGCYTNFLVIADVDGDEDLDVVMANGGGYYERDIAEESSLYLNDGEGAYSNVTSSVLGEASSRLRQVAVGDVDGDGDMDIYQPGGYGADADKLFIQTSQGTFADEAVQRLPPFTWSDAGAAHLGDLDNDGDLDLVVADWGAAPRKSPGNTLVYLNDGEGYFTEQPIDVVPPPMAPEIGTAPIDIDLADIDGDFDLDILVNHRDGQSRIFLNDGEAKFSDGTEGNYPPKVGAYTYNVEACDFDEDGDLDLLLDNAGGYEEFEYDTGEEVVTYRLYKAQVLVNDGTGHFTDETAETISGEPAADDNAVKCADVTGDGHYDLIVASLTNIGEKLLINDGSAKFTYEEGGFPGAPPAEEGGDPESDPTLGIDVADVDGDGVLDVITGQGEGAPRVDRIYKGNGGADVTKPSFRAFETPSATAGEPIAVRFAVTDAYTSETGQHVKDVFLTYQVDGEDEEVAEARFVGGDLFRAVIPPQPAGAKIVIGASATDRVELTSEADPIEITVLGAPVTGEGGEAGEAGSGGNAGEPSSAGRGGSAGSATEPEGGEGGEPSGGGTSSKGATGEDEDDGCGCSVPGAPSRNYGALSALVLAGLALRRRRARS